MLKILERFFSEKIYACGIRILDQPSDCFVFEKKPFQILFPTQKEWYADSFCIHENNATFLFVEIMGRNGKKGSIGVSRYYPEEGFSKVTEVLREDFHLSYPNIFRYKDKYYMIPETYQAHQIRLYEAEEFPFKWNLCKVLLDDSNAYVDSSFLPISPCIFLLYTYDINNSRPSWFEFDLEKMSLEKVSWIGQVAQERPGGNAININGKHYRVLQDCSHVYGEKLKLYRIDEFDYSCKRYSETFVGEVSTEMINTKSRVHFERIHTLSVSDNVQAVDLLFTRYSIFLPVKKNDPKS